MNVQQSKGLFIKLQLFLLISILFLVVRIDLWPSFPIDVFAFILLHELLAISLSVASLFSGKHDQEGKLEIALKDTSPAIKVLFWILVFLLSLIFSAYTMIIPYPPSILIIFIIFSWAFTFFAFFRQRFPINWIAWIIETESDSLFGRLNRYSVSVLFYFPYIIFTRIFNLPFVVRKPLALLQFIILFILCIISVNLFDRMD